MTTTGGIERSIDSHRASADRKGTRVETGRTSTSSNERSISVRQASAVTSGGICLGGAEAAGSACSSAASRPASAGDWSIGCQLEITARAPGRRMRRSSEKPARGRGRT